MQGETYLCFNSESAQMFDKDDSSFITYEN